MKCPKDIKWDDWFGEGNNTVGPEGILIKTIENEVVQYSEKEKEDRLELSNIDGVVAAAKAEKSKWESDTRAERNQREAIHRNKVHQLSVIDHQVNHEGAELSEQQTVRVAALRAEVKELESRIKVAKYDEEKLEQKIKRCQEKKAKLKAKVTSYHRKRKIDDDGVFQQMEKVLHKYKIYRGAYHGGDFQGPHLRRYMENAEAIFAEYLPIIKAANRPEGPERVMSDEDIDKFCADCVKLLQTIDAIHANLSKWYFDIEDEDTKKALQELKVLHRRALELVRKLGMSVTPKWTLEEDHVEDNHEWLIENGWGGEIWEDESYVEHEHQQGVKDNRRTHAMKSFRERESAQMKSSHRSSNQEVQDVSLEKKRKAKARPGGQSSTKKHVKGEYRMEAATDGAAETDADGAPAII